MSAPTEGDTVLAGDPLIRFDKTDLETSRRQAELNLAQAELDLKKARLAYEGATSDLADKEKLLSSGAIPRDQVQAARDVLVNAELAIESAQIRVDQSALLLDKAQIELEGAVVDAPFDGVVIRGLVSPGDVVNAGAVLVTFADVSRVRLKAEVDEFDIGKVAAGLSVTVVSDALSDLTLKSKVERVSPAAEVVNSIG